MQKPARVDANFYRAASGTTQSDGPSWPMNAFGSSLSEPGHAGFALGRGDSR